MKAGFCFFPVRLSKAEWRPAFIQATTYLRGSKCWRGGPFAQMNISELKQQLKQFSATNTIACISQQPLHMAIYIFQILQLYTVCIMQLHGLIKPESETKCKSNRQDSHSLCRLNSEPVAFWRVQSIHDTEAALALCSRHGKRIHALSQFSHNPGWFSWVHFELAECEHSFSRLYRITISSSSYHHHHLHHHIIIISHVRDLNSKWRQETAGQLRQTRQLRVQTPNPH